MHILCNIAVIRHFCNSYGAGLFYTLTLWQFSHTPIELKPIPHLEKEVKLAAVCFVGGGCGSTGFASADIDLSQNSGQMCQDAGYAQTCGEGQRQDSNDICPNDPDYTKCCPLNCPADYAASIPEGYIQDGDACQSCDGDFFKIKPNPCTGYETCTNGPDDGAALCLSGSQKKYDKCKSCIPTSSCTGYEFDSYRSCSYDYASCNNGCGSTKYKCLECIPEAKPSGWVGSSSSCPDGQYVDSMDTCGNRYYLCTTASYECRLLQKQLRNTTNKKVVVSESMYCGNDTLYMQEGQTLSGTNGAVLEFEAENGNICGIQVRTNYNTTASAIENLTIKTKGNRAICTRNSYANQLPLNITNLTLQLQNASAFKLEQTQVNFYGDNYFKPIRKLNPCSMGDGNGSNEINLYDGSSVNINELYFYMFGTTNLYGNAKLKVKSDYDSFSSGDIYNLHDTSSFYLDTYIQTPESINLYDNTSLYAKSVSSLRVKKYSAASEASLQLSSSIYYNYVCDFPEREYGVPCINYFKVTTPYEDMVGMYNIEVGSHISAEDGIYECSSKSGSTCDWEKISDTPYPTHDFTDFFKGSFWD